MQHPSTIRPRPSGFSLVELSIVLVILGLLVGGILSGQSLIRAAELRSVSTEYSRYAAATQTFRDKYFAIPGDMNNATSFWLRMTATADCITNSAASVAATGACDGDGDGVIEPGAATVSTANERFMFWRHLALAGLIEGTYTGQAGPGASNGEQPVIGTNAPRSRLSNAGWTIWWNGQAADGATFFAFPTTHWIMFGSALGNSTLGDIIKAEEAWNIDTKIDDGKPSYGVVLTPASGNPNGGTNCSTTSVASTAQYDLTKTTNDCAFFIKI